MRFGACLMPALLAATAATGSAQPAATEPPPLVATASAPIPTPASAPAASEPAPVVNLASAPMTSPVPAPGAVSAPPVAASAQTGTAPPGSLVATTTATASAAAAESALAVRNGDVVVFLGDELCETPEARRANRPGFPQLVETFLTVRYPALHIRYISAGWSGDTAGRARLRLERDVLRHQPNVVVVCLGMNDPGYLAFVPARLEQFRRDLTDIVVRCHQAGARVWLMTPPCVEAERGKKVRVTRDGQRAIADLEVIRYNDTLAQYAAATREIASATPPTRVADWFADSFASRARVQVYSGDEFLTVDGRTPTFRGMILGAATLLRAWGAQPIRATIELDWHEGTAQVASHLGKTGIVPVQITEDGRRILHVADLPLPWPLPGDPGGALQDGWESSDLCQISLRVPNPPEMGVTLLHESDDQGTTSQWPITPAQLHAGFNLATAEPIRSLKGVRDLFNLIGTKNRTRDTIWRRLELSAPQERELTAAHQQLIEAWKAYVAGYEQIISRYPKTFTARFVLAETMEIENLPTSQPTRPPRLMRPSEKVLE